MGQIRTLERHLFEQQTPNALVDWFGNGDSGRAEAKIFEQFAFFGITEYFAESVRALSAIFPWMAKTPLVKNVNMSRKDGLIVGGSAEERFVEKNKKDMELYARAVKEFQRRISSDIAGGLKAVEPYLDGQTFMVTYGDGVSDIDITEEIAFHRRHGKSATVAAVRLPGRYGCLDMDADDSVSGFEEKPLGESGWINGGFFILDPDVMRRLTPDSPMLERELFPSLAHEGRLRAYRHVGFWKSCDTLQDKLELERIWNSGNVPWL